MNLWITGAKGFIGRHVARALALAGHDVAGIGHGLWPESEHAGWGVRHWLQAGVTVGNLEQLARRAGRPDAVIHLAGGSSVGAAVANPHEDEVRTVGSTADLLEWLRLEAPAARLVAASSAAVYGAGHDGPIDENAALDPFSPYGHHKLMMEQLCRSYAASYGVNAVVLRLFSVYGPELRKQLLWDACTRLAAGTGRLQLGGTGDEVRDWTHVGDVARAMHVAVAMPLQGLQVVNVGSGRGTTVRSIARHLIDAWGEPAEAEFSGVGRAGDPFSLVADARRLAALGVECDTEVRDGIADYVRWFRRASRDA
jgi:UDP-glucose 4-epimerase